MFFASNLISLATEILQKSATKNLKITTAESCTGGLLSALFTEISGASKVFERGFVTYSNEAKIQMLGVKKETLENFGAVSKEVAGEMAQGALKNSSADVAIAITGVAGPNGGSAEKPVGLVYIALNERVQKFNFGGDRSEVRKSAIIAALEMLESATQIQ